MAEDYELNFNVVIEDIDLTSVKQNQIGNINENSNLVIRTSSNEQLIYLDGACDGDAPLYLGIVKSRGSQKEKLPVEANDFLGGLQIYARKEPGSSLGYHAKQTPLVAGIQFKIAKEKESGLPTDMLIALSDENGMSVKLIVDQHGNLKTTGDISSGKLTITDNEVVGNKIKRFVRVNYDGNDYALPLYSIR